MKQIEYVDNFEEVDEAMFNKLSGVLIDGKEVPVTYYSPDVDLSELVKPSIVFYRSEPFPDNSRFQQDPIKDNFVYDESGKLISTETRRPPEPWSLTYTVRTLYEFQQDGVQLNRHLFRTFPRTACLVIHNIEYDISYFGGSLTGSGYKDFGKTKEGKKDLSETFLYRVDLLLDLYDREVVKVVQEVITDTSQF